MHQYGKSDAIYGLGVVGAAVYYIKQATTFWAGCVGVLKAIVWPAIVMYKLLEYYKL